MHFVDGMVENPHRQFREITMGPFPHDAPPVTISADNPMGTDGFEFVEYAHPNPEALHALFKLMGFLPDWRDHTNKMTVDCHGDTNELVHALTGAPRVCSFASPESRATP